MSKQITLTMFAGGPARTTARNTTTMTSCPATWTTVAADCPLARNLARCLAAEVKIERGNRTARLDQRSLQRLCPKYSSFPALRKHKSGCAHLRMQTHLRSIHVAVHLSLAYFFQLGDTSRRYPFGDKDVTRAIKTGIMRMNELAVLPTAGRLADLFCSIGG